MSSEASEDENATAKRSRPAPATPSHQTSIAGQLTKPRVSPRNLTKKDYKTIEDPFLGSDAYDADGNEVFEKSSEPEDITSDEEYGNAGAVVKEEDEMAV